MFPPLTIRSFYLLLVPVSTFLFLLAPAASAVTIFYDDFNGTGNLDGSAPDTRPGNEEWSSAATNWGADGTLASSGGFDSAWIPFSPASGMVYRLSLDVDPVSSASSAWFALGFGTALNPGAFYNSAGAPWMLNRSDDAHADVIQTFTGAVQNAVSHNLNPDQVGFVNLAIELDTRAAGWGFEFFVAGQSIRTGTFTSGNPNIQYIGFGNHEGLLGAVDNFTLAANIPEPNTALLFGIGLVGLTLPRRPSSHRGR